MEPPSAARSTYSEYASRAALSAAQQLDRSPHPGLRYARLTMFSGGDYEEVARWLTNFVTAHAKRDNLYTEAVIERDRPREGQSYGIRLRRGDERRPRAGEPPIELSFSEVAAGRGNLAWCDALAERVRALARELLPARAGGGSGPSDR